MQIGKAIKLFRTQRGLSQAEVARRADISISYLSLLERDKRDPNFSTLVAIAAAVDVPMTLLISTAEGDAHLGIELREKLSYQIIKHLKASSDE